MRFVQWMLAGCAAGTVLGLCSASADALTLTGSWTGSVQCNKYIGKNLRTPSEASVLEIVQSGDSLVMRLNNETYFLGVVLEDANDPNNKGAIAFAECGTSSDLTGSNSLGQAKASTGRSGRIAGIRVHAAGTGAFPTSWVETCRLKFSRENTATPQLPTSCPPLP